MRQSFLRKFRRFLRFCFLFFYLLSALNFCWFFRRMLLISIFATVTIFSFASLKSYASEVGSDVEDDDSVLLDPSVFFNSEKSNSKFWELRRFEKFECYFEKFEFFRLFLEKFEPFQILSKIRILWILSKIQMFYFSFGNSNFWFFSRISFLTKMLAKSILFAHQLHTWKHEPLHLSIYFGNP